VLLRFFLNVTYKDLFIRSIGYAPCTDDARSLIDRSGLQRLDRQAEAFRRRGPSMKVLNQNTKFRTFSSIDIPFRFLPVAPVQISRCMGLFSRNLYVPPPSLRIYIALIRNCRGRDSRLNLLQSFPGIFPVS
jgi:hypothetical protein